MSDRTLIVRKLCLLFNRQKRECYPTEIETFDDETEVLTTATVDAGSPDIYITLPSPERDSIPTPSISPSSTPTPTCNNPDYMGVYSGLGILESTNMFSMIHTPSKWRTCSNHSPRPPFLRRRSWFVWTPTVSSFQTSNEVCEVIIPIAFHNHSL